MSYTGHEDDDETVLERIEHAIRSPSDPSTEAQALSVYLDSIADSLFSIDKHAEAAVQSLGSIAASLAKLADQGRT